ncbi:MAG TPA: hypothetical protein VFR09_03140 [Alphaproteobacteria bacterium]|nr:hypothetical protein [Alphaproteobacteria bacterium]
MDRRHFLTSFAALAAASGARAKSAPAKNTRLEDVDFDELLKDVKTDLDKDGIPLPVNYTPFPKTAINSPIYDVSTDTLEGEDDNLSALLHERERLNALYDNEDSCMHMALEGSPRSWRAFTLLHEMAHRISYFKGANGFSLFEEATCAVNKIPAQDFQTYFINISGDIDPPASFVNDDLYTYNVDLLSKLQGHDDILVAYGTRYPIYESMADLAAGLYILSNYPGGETKNFLRQMIAMRNSSYDDYKHPSDGLQAALDVYAKHPLKKLSLVDATKLAAQILPTLPRYNRPIADQAATIRADIKNIMSVGDKSASVDEPWWNNGVSARNITCRLPTQSPAP